MAANHNMFKNDISVASTSHNNEEQHKYDARVICELLPFIDFVLVEDWLLQGSKSNKENFKAEVLQTLIEESLEEGRDVKEEAFWHLGAWQREGINCAVDTNRGELDGSSTFEGKILGIPIIPDREIIQNQEKDKIVCDHDKCESILISDDDSSDEIDNLFVIDDLEPCNSDKRKIDNINCEDECDVIMERKKSKIIESDNITSVNNNCRQSDIKQSMIILTEAKEICELVPFFDSKQVLYKLRKNMLQPQRKALILKYYIQRAERHNKTVNDLAHKALAEWNNCFNDLNEVESRSSNNEISNVKNINSRIEIIHSNTLLAASDVDNNLNLDMDDGVEEYLKGHSLPERKDWYLNNLKFLNEIVPNLSKFYIATKLIDCKTDIDVSDLSVHLLDVSLKEEQDKVMQNDDTNFDDLKNGSSILRNNNLINNLHDTLEKGELPDIEIEIKAEQQAENKIQVHIISLKEMFIDADPDYICERANEVNGDHTKFTDLVTEMMDNKDYPKMSEYILRQKNVELRRKFIEGMSVEEFMQYFDDPEKAFSDVTRIVSDLYKKNAAEQLLIDFPFHLKTTIDKIHRVNRYFYFCSHQDLKKASCLRKSKRKEEMLTGDVDDMFLKECCYVQLEEKIKSHREQKERDENLAFIFGKNNGSLEECQCCFDNEVLKQKMSPCDAEKNHYFCNNCIRRFSGEQIGQDKLNFPCLAGDSCKGSFSLSVLKNVLKSSVFSNVLKRKQMEEIESAEIEDLVSCPFCSFVTIMPNKDDKIFKCLNPDCMRDSCRLCKEANHIPLRCDEAKKNDARTFLENEMSEAIVRECNSCKKRFIMEEGCNKMKCSCGAMMCYLCKMTINGYDHFVNLPPGTANNKVTNPHGKCLLFTNTSQLHAEEVEKKAEEIKKITDPSIKELGNFTV